MISIISNLIKRRSMATVFHPRQKCPRWSSILIIHRKQDELQHLARDFVIVLSAQHSFSLTNLSPARFKVKSFTDTVFGIKTTLLFCEWQVYGFENPAHIKRQDYHHLCCTGSIQGFSHTFLTLHFVFAKHIFFSYIHWLGEAGVGLTVYDWLRCLDEFDQNYPFPRVYSHICSHRHYTTF